VYQNGLSSVSSGRRSVTLCHILTSQHAWGEERIDSPRQVGCQGQRVHLDNNGIDIGKAKEKVWLRRALCYGREIVAMKCCKSSVSVVNACDFLDISYSATSNQPTTTNYAPTSLRLFSVPDSPQSRSSQNHLPCPDNARSPHPHPPSSNVMSMLHLRARIQIYSSA